MKEKAKYETKKPPVHFTEAPASVNIKFQWQGFDIMLTIRDERVNSALKKMEAAIGHLQGLDAEPHKGYARNSNGGGNSGKQAPFCPTHNKPMLPSKKGEGFYCPVKIAEDDGTGKPVYCKQYVK